MRKSLKNAAALQASQLSEKQLNQVRGGSGWKVIYQRPDGSTGSEMTSNLESTHNSLISQGYIVIEDVVF